jgi:hypothetical protein
MNITIWCHCCSTWNTIHEESDYLQYTLYTNIAAKTVKDNYRCSLNSAVGNGAIVVEQHYCDGIFTECARMILREI